MDGASHVVKCINLNTTVNLPNQLKTIHNKRKKSFILVRDCFNFSIKIAKLNLGLLIFWVGGEFTFFVFFCFNFLGNTEEKTFLELFQLYENDSSRVDIEESKNLASKMPEKTKEMNRILTERLEKLNARYPFLNPTSKKSLPNKANVPTVVNNGVDGKEVWLKFKNNGAKVVKAELIYTTDGGVRGETWVPIDMELSDNKVSVTLPKGTTHYVFNLVDENNFLISYPEAGYLKETKIFATKAIAVE